MQIKFKEQHCNRLSPKNLTPWRDSNPRSSNPLVETVATKPRRQDVLLQTLPQCLKIFYDEIVIKGLDPKTFYICKLASKICCKL
jgi:hypothetical protein